MMICPIPGLLEQETFSNISAYFLGAILSGDESYRLYGSKKKVWLAVVKHNIGYCTQDQLSRHLHALTIMAAKVRATVYSKRQLLDRSWFTPNKIGFAVGFESAETVTLDNLISYARNILPSLSPTEKECLLLGAFDGRCSIDVNKATGDIRYLVLDCGNDQAMEFFTEILDKLYVRYNCNYARDRLEGGLPRKPQLRIAASSVGIYAQRIGFISTARMEILSRAMGSSYEVLDDSHTLPSRKKLGQISGKNTDIPKRQGNVTKNAPAVQTKQEYNAAIEKESIKEEANIHLDIGDTVIHKVFGNGTITSFNGKYLSVDFDGTVKKFAFPSAFSGGFLRIEK